MTTFRYTPTVVIMDNDDQTAYVETVEQLFQAHKELSSGWHPESREYANVLGSNPQFKGYDMANADSPAHWAQLLLMEGGGRYSLDKIYLHVETGP